MADSYVCSGAMMKCTMGSSPAKLTVLPSRTVFLAGQPQANISDHMSMANLAPFGVCRSLAFPPTASATAAALGTLTPMPCIHNTPMPWMGGKMDTLIKGQPALLKSCKCQCMWGGTITLINNGQVGEGAEKVTEVPRGMQINSRDFVALRSTEEEHKTFGQRISDAFNRTKRWWNHRKYIKKIEKTKYEYNPEQIDVTLAHNLTQELVSLDAVRNLSSGTIDQRVDFVENTLVPKILGTMDIDSSVSFNWYQDENSSLGYYSENTQSLNININILSNINQSTDTIANRQVLILINTIVHECKHARQWDEIEGRKNHGYSEDLKQKWLENMYNYISSEESDEGYMKQPVELDAWEFADRVISDGLLDNFKLKHSLF